MATRPQEVAVRRIIACFAPGSLMPAQAIAALAKEMQAELLGLFIEDVELLRLAALPFAAEVGFPSAVRRPLDVAALERTLRAQAAALRAALARAVDPSVTWSLRVTRATAAETVAGALAEGFAPSLLIPPGGDLRARHGVIAQSDLTEARLRALLAERRPVLVLPRP
jgi:hypothetical protein